ncbi:MAG: 2,3-bisphosphoglycerate-independent phosphoglycerate mutase, partial [Clostridia bacterium]
MVVLVVLDGWGERKCKLGNAIKLAKTPTYDFLKKNFPFTLLSASEMAVGLAKNQEGNSEAGHLNLGAGKVVLQDLSIINNAIKDKSFQKNPALNAALDNVTKNNSSLHILALVSNGCVHSAMEHIKEIITCAKQKGIKNLFVHAFTDGRDTKQRSASKFLYELERHMSKAHLGQISSITGRIYAMDREERYERLKPAYEAIANAKADEDFSSWQQCIKSNYQKNISDEFFPAATIAGGKRIEAGDSVVFANFRNDRAKEL